MLCIKVLYDIRQTQSDLLKTSGNCTIIHTYSRTKGFGDCRYHGGPIKGPLKSLGHHSTGIGPPFSREAQSPLEKLRSLGR